MDTSGRKQELGRRIQVLRTRRGISQRSFALMIGVSQPYLSSIESGRGNVGFNNLCKIADGLGVSLESLFLGIQ